MPGGKEAGAPIIGGQGEGNLSHAQAYALAMHELQPILFEEVYVKSIDRIK
jgi:hypothetical protein